VPRVYVTGRGRPPTSLGCLGSLAMAGLVIVALVLIATVGLIVLVVVAAGLVVAAIGLLAQRVFHRGVAGGTMPPGGPGPIIDTTATESTPDAPHLPPAGRDGPGD
jgi:hypothetical protein